MTRVAAALVLALFAGTAEARIWTVGGGGADFPLISPAIAAAADGDVVEVRAGVYREDLALRERGCTEATLWTEERNERPRRFYEAAGWKADGEAQERVWNGAPLRELRYRKAL